MGLASLSKAADGPTRFLVSSLSSLRKNAAGSRLRSGPRVPSVSNTGSAVLMSSNQRSSHIAVRRRTGL
jgi:hypothetical protein